MPPATLITSKPHHIWQGSGRDAFLCAHASQALRSGRKIAIQNRNSQQVNAVDPGTLQASLLPVPDAPAAADPSPGAPVATWFRWPAQMPGSEVAVIGSFNGWSDPVPLARGTPGGDWLCSLSLPPGPINFKFIVDGRYQASPCEPIAAESGGGAYNNHRTVQATCEVRWPSASLGGGEVRVTGDWVEWGDALPLPVEPTSGDHVLRCCLPPGSYTYRFLVDGAWRVHAEVDTVHTLDGRLVNRLEVPLPTAFRIFYSTGWPDAVLRVRALDAAGLPLPGGWREVALRDTPSRARPSGDLSRWRGAEVSANAALWGGAPAALEFVPASGDGSKEDLPPGGGSYLCPHPGGYKLQGGRLRPFPRASAPPAMLVADLDGTLVGDCPASDAATAEFCSYWEASAALTGSVLVYNTGRSLGSFQGLWEAKAGDLPLPDALITAVGTKIFLLNREGGSRGTTTGTQWVEDTQWSRLLDQGWDLEGVREAGQAALDGAPPGMAHWLDDGSEHPHRIALSVCASETRAVMAALQAGVAMRGLTVELIVSGTGDWRYLDCVSAHAGKLAALEHCRALFGVPRERCMAAGDSGNDALMLGGRNKAVVVGNAQAELLDWVLTQPQDPRLVVADAPWGRGVLEGLARHGLY